MLKVKVKPNSPRNLIKKISESEFIAEITEKPENNKANSKLISILSKEFKVHYSKIKIKNPSSRNKIIEIKQ